MEPMNLILDTDVGADCDDMMALAYLVFAQRYRQIRIKAVSYSNGCPAGPMALAAFFGHLSEETPPIGCPPRGRMKKYDHYTSVVAGRFAEYARSFERGDAVSVLRRALVESGRAVLCGIGPMTNLTALLESKGDAISPLDGGALLRRHAERIVLMAGRFDSADAAEAEWNVKVDVAAAQTVLQKSPVPVDVLPYETGLHIITGKPLMERFENGNPVGCAFWEFPGVREKGGRHSFDGAAVLYAAEGCGDFFDESEQGSVTVDADGKTHFIPTRGGLHRIVRVKVREGESEQACKDRIAAYLDACAMRIYAEWQPPEPRG